MYKIRLKDCPHNNQLHVLVIEHKRFEKFISCSGCDHRGPNLWLCLYKNCSYVGCSEQVKDHSTDHFKNNNDHCIHINLSSRRAWCYFCEKEVSVSYEMASQNFDVFASTLGIFSNKYIDNGYELLATNSGLVGLQNIANTCYMNSALQALSNLLPMTHYFLSRQDLIEDVNEDASHRPKIAGLARSYQRLMQEIWSNERKKFYVAPRGILYGIRSVHPMFRGFQQHDTQEFLRCFMDQLHDELKEQKVDKCQGRLFVGTDDRSQSETSSLSSSPNISDTEYESCESNLSESTTEFIDPTKNKIQNVEYIKVKSVNEDCIDNGKFSSIITEVFDGKLLSSVQCLTCDRISRREETFQDLSLPIPNRDFLHVLHQNYSPSITSLNFVDVNAVRNHDGWLSWMWNFVKSWLWGPTVTLHDCMASFFSADELKGDNMYSCEKCKKLRTGIKFSRVLELPEVLCIHLKRFRHDLSYSSKISSHVLFPLEGFDMRPYLDKDCSSNVSVYNLISVICHHGTVGGGHYTCLARNAITNRWYEYDDQHVTEVSVDVVENSQAYVLFYQKHNPQMTFLRAQASELSILNPVNLSDIKFYLSRQWVSKFCTFAEPGPINNSALLCSHGGILPSKSSVMCQITVAISQPVWEFLYRKFGGGPAINMLYECEHCKKRSESLLRRQLYELNVFTKYNSISKDIENGTIFAISMPWLRKWQNFARGVTDKEPGPITNAHILPTEKDGNLLHLRSVKHNSDFAQINGPLWRFLFEIYGGGPEIILRRGVLSKKHINVKDNFFKSTESLSDTESNIGEIICAKTKSESEDSLNENKSDGEKSSKNSPTIDTSCSRSIAFESQNMENAPLYTRPKKRHKRNHSFKKSNFFGPKGNYVVKHLETIVQENNTVKSPSLSEDGSTGNITFTQRKKVGRQVDKQQSKDTSESIEKVVLQKFAVLPE